MAHSTCRVIATGLCAVLWNGTPAAQDAIVPVYVRQPSAASVDEALKNRQASTKDLTAALVQMKSLKLVDDRAMAVVVVEVIDRLEIPAERAEQVRPGEIGLRTDRIKIIRVTLTARDFSTEMDARSEEAYFSLLPTWKAAAGVAAEGIDRLIRRYHGKLMR